MTKSRDNATNVAGDISGVTASTGLSGGGSSGDLTLTNTMATEIDAKGDLVVGTGADTFARLAVSGNGETLVADSSTATGLRYTENYAAGKNKILNGDFGINQRAFSSTTQTTIFLFDRWKSASAGGTTTWSEQTFTPGIAPEAGYEGKNYLRIVTTSQASAGDFAGVTERIEGVRTLAGETATVSFWAQANSGTPKIGTTLLQIFGSGGSPSSPVVVNGQSATISTSFARYSFTFSVPSISGKTIGTANDDSVQFEIFVSAGSDFDTRSGTVGIQNNTFEIWGVQVEAGSVATAFQTATGTLAGELAACQRYYIRYKNLEPVGSPAGASSTTQIFIPVSLPTSMRVKPTSIDFLNTEVQDGVNAGIAVTPTINATFGGASTILITATAASGLTQFRPFWLYNDTPGGFFGLSAEL